MMIAAQSVCFEADWQLSGAKVSSVVIISETQPIADTKVGIPPKIIAPTFYPFFTTNPAA